VLPVREHDYGGKIGKRMGMRREGMDGKSERRCGGVLESFSNPRPNSVPQVF